MALKGNPHRDFLKMIGVGAALTAGMNVAIDGKENPPAVDPQLVVRPEELTWTWTN